jgi:hypothetical protein
MTDIYILGVLFGIVIGIGVGMTASAIRYNYMMRNGIIRPGRMIDD